MLGIFSTVWEFWFYTFGKRVRSRMCALQSVLSCVKLAEDNQGMCVEVIWDRTEGYLCETVLPNGEVPFIWCRFTAYWVELATNKDS